MFYPQALAPVCRVSESPDSILDSTRIPAETMASRYASSYRHDPTDNFRIKGAITAAEVNFQLHEALDAKYNSDKNIIIWLGEVLRRSLFRDLGYSSIQAYALEKLDLNPNRINRYLRLINDLEKLPIIRKALFSGRLGWTKARELVKVASPRNEDRWLIQALKSSRRKLEAMVLQAWRKALAERVRNPGQPNLSACNESATDAAETRPNSESDIFKEPADAAGATGAADTTDTSRGALKDEGITAVVFRFSPLELARYEEQIETILKKRILTPATPKEQILLSALEELLISAERPEDEPPAAQTRETQSPRSANPVTTPRHHQSQEQNSNCAPGH